MTKTGYLPEIQYYGKGDGCRGVVRDSIGSGIFLELDNGEIAYACFALNPGSEVICNVTKPADGDLRAQVVIESVIWHAPRNAA